MNYCALGEPDPSGDAKPVHGRDLTLEYAKKALVLHSPRHGSVGPHQEGRELYTLRVCQQGDQVREAL